MQTDNMWLKLHDEYTHHQWLRVKLQALQEHDKAKEVTMFTLLDS